jgi:hypothetical protein
MTHFSVVMVILEDHREVIVVIQIRLSLIFLDIFLLYVLTLITSFCSCITKARISYTNSVVLLCI